MTTRAVKITDADKINFTADILFSIYINIEHNLPVLVGTDPFPDH